MTSSAHSILRLDSSSRKEGSVSRKLTQRIIDRLQEEQPETKLTVRDLSPGIPTISEAWISANYTPAEKRSDAQKDVLRLSDELLAEIKAADTIVIGLPIYNFGIPSTLKSWIDLVARVGETFYYTENGPVGMLENKKAIIALASDGVPLGSPMDFASSYLKHVLGFIGITDATFVPATGIAFDPDNVVNAAEQKIDELELDRAA
jgi:FMN-dependent NADH-azoreductase